METKIDNLNERESAWINAQLERARDFVAANEPAKAGRQFTVKELDYAFTAWIRNGATEDSQAINGVINCVGIAFGQFLVDETGLRWVVATDEYGSDLAVYGLPGAGDVLVYPANFIAKRWEKREVDFIERSVQRIAQQVRSIRKG